MEILLDENVSTEKDVKVLGIQVGDIIAMDPRTVVTPSGYIKSRFLDDKLSAAILLGIAKEVAEKTITLNRKVSLLFTVYEEVGHGGSSIPADTEEMICVDMGCVGDDLGVDAEVVLALERHTGRIRDRADAELQSRFSPQLAQKAADYMDYLTSGRYDELVLARDLSAKARSADDPTPRDTAYLSAGTADLLYLSVRLALCELTCPTDDPCPLVLDDTLVNFDDARARRAMALFREIAQHRQVILFTCHERDCPAREQ